MRPLADILREINTAHRPGSIEHADALVSALIAERAHVVALAGALRDVLGWGHAPTIPDLIDDLERRMDRAAAVLTAYDTPTAAGGSGQRAVSLPAQESPAGGDVPPTTGRAGG